LIRTIRFINAATDGASTRSVARINFQHRNTYPSRLVLDKAFQLEERPIGVSCSLLASNSGPRPNASQVLNGNRPLRVLRLLHESFTDRVVRIGLEASLSPTDTPQFTPSSFRALALQVAAAMSINPTLLFNHCAGERLPVRVGRQIDDAQVNAEYIVNCSRVGFVNVAGRQQIELTAPSKQVAFALLVLQQRKLACAAGKGDTQATVNCPNRDRLLINVPAQNASIVGDATSQVERAFGLAIQLVGVGHFSDATHHDLRRQFRERLAGIVVGQLVQFELPKGLGFPRAVAQVIASRVRQFKRAPERSSLLRRRQELDLSGKFHVLNIAQKCHVVKYRKEEGRFLSRLKAGVSTPDVL